jgi:hypothetical protein
MDDLLRAGEVWPDDLERAFRETSIDAALAAAAGGPPAANLPRRHPQRRLDIGHEATPAATAAAA